MGAIVAAARALGAVNGPVLALGRGVGIVCMALMVAFILVQVVWRYVLSDPLPWPEEAARFLMLWLMVVAPTALRRGGFVAIDMIQLALPRAVGGALTLGLLALALLVLAVGIDAGLTQLSNPLAARATTSTLYYPTGEGWTKVPRRWMEASLLVGLVMMASVAVELLLRQVAVLGGAGGRLPEIPHTATVGAE